MDLSKVNPNLFSHLDLSKPRWSQDNYIGRAKHFFTVTNPLNVLLTNKQLDDAKSLVEAVRNGNPVPPSTTEDKVWEAKYRYESAFHPDTKEKMLLPGRMSAQVPMNMTITGCMLTFYKTTPQVILWQWLNQTFNAAVNYTNRSGDANIPKSRLVTSYVCATSGAVGTALYLNSIAKKLPSLVGRFVPFAAVASANCVNIPLMRFSELKDGITVTTSSGEKLGKSKKAAKSAILQVTMSRIGMALPAMSITPLVMNKLAKGPLLKKYPFLNAPIQIALVGLCLSFATPLCCALFPQQSSMPVSGLETELREALGDREISVVYFNKGL